MAIVCIVWGAVQSAVAIDGGAAGWSACSAVDGREMRDFASSDRHQGLIAPHT